MAVRAGPASIRRPPAREAWEPRSCPGERTKRPFGTRADAPAWGADAVSSGPAADSPFALAANPHFVAVGDVNGDERLDPYFHNNGCAYPRAAEYTEGTP